jgi:predicted amidohydrolase
MTVSTVAVVQQAPTCLQRDATLATAVAAIGEAAGSGAL